LTKKTGQIDTCKSRKVTIKKDKIHYFKIGE